MLIRNFQWTLKMIIRRDKEEKMKEKKLLHKGKIMELTFVLKTKTYCNE